MCEQITAETAIEAEGASWNARNILSKLLREDTGLRRDTPVNINLFFEQQTKMIQLLLERSSEQYAQEAMQRLQSLPQSNRMFFKPHEHIRQSVSFFAHPSELIAHKTVGSFFFQAEDGIRNA